MKYQTADLILSHTLPRLRNEETKSAHQVCMSIMRKARSAIEVPDTTRHEKGLLFDGLPRKIQAARIKTFVPYVRQAILSQIRGAGCWRNDPSVLLKGLLLRVAH